MNGYALLVGVFIAIVLIVVLVRHPRFSVRPVGRVLGFMAFLVFPILLSMLGLTSHINNSKSTEFCLSCHTMKPYGESLMYDDPDYLPAAHFQNHRISADRACFTCHTSYTMFGDFKSKLRGLRHVYVYYLGTIPERPQLYSPFLNHECLHCHGGARSFEESDMHMDIRDELESNNISCLECHDMTHDVENQDSHELWEPEAP